MGIRVVEPPSHGDDAGLAWFARERDIEARDREELGWARRHAPEQVPVYRCNYKTRATARVAKAASGGLKVWY
jgi:hypothetical protein